MSYWLTIKQMSEKYGVSDVTVRHWMEQGYVAYSKVNAVTLVDEDSFKSCLEAHKRPGMDKDYLGRMVKEKRSITSNRRVCLPPLPPFRNALLMAVR